MFYVTERQNQTFGMSCVLASTEYMALEHRTATASSNIDILGFTIVFQGFKWPPFLSIIL